MLTYKWLEYEIWSWNSPMCLICLHVSLRVVLISVERQQCNNRIITVSKTKSFLRRQVKSITTDFILVCWVKELPAYQKVVPACRNGKKRVNRVTRFFRILPRRTRVPVKQTCWLLRCTLHHSCVTFWSTLNQTFSVKFNNPAWTRMTQKPKQ